ncbi:MAG: glycosyltransferase family 2 protein [Betaproteobacteria bacterium]
MSRNVATAVSAIIPCHNCARTIERAVRSILAQSCPPAELVLVDDASSDDGRTLELLHRLREQAQGGPVALRVLEHRANLGAPSARNTGWEASSAPLLAFLDADDAWDPRKLEVQTAWMMANPAAAISGHLSARHGMPHGPAMAPQRIGAARMLLSNAFATRTVMLRRDLPLRFDPVFRRSDDYLLWLRIVLNGGEAWLLREVLAYSYKRDFGESGLSRDLWAMECSELQVYRTLADERRIPRLAHGALVAFSLAKHLRRVLGRALAA